MNLINRLKEISKKAITRISPAVALALPMSGCVSDGTMHPATYHSLGDAGRVLQLAPRFEGETLEQYQNRVAFGSFAEAKGYWLMEENHAQRQAEATRSIGENIGKSIRESSRPQVGKIQYKELPLDIDNNGIIDATIRGRPTSGVRKAICLADRDRDGIPDCVVIDRNADGIFEGTYKEIHPTSWDTEVLLYRNERKFYVGDKLYRY